MYILNKIINFFKFDKIKALSYNNVATWKTKRNNKANNKVNNNALIEYLINDPSTPTLKKNVTPPIYNGNPAISVLGYKGGGFSRISPEGQAASCYLTVANTINFVNSKVSTPIPRWAGTSVLQIVPRAGIDLNAYYNRKALKFFYASDSMIGGTVYTCDSTDIVAHELGHAILDAYRPQTWNAMSIEVSSLHEAFGDFMSIINLLSHDEAISFVLNQNKGNLKMSNIVSKVAEQFGEAIYKLSPSNSGRLSNALRDAINSYKYVNPSTLSEDTPDNVLSSEFHNFSRIFLGTFYDILIMMYQDFRQSGMTKPNALKSARDLILRYVILAIQNAPINTKFYNSFARTMLWADLTTNNNKFNSKMNQIFTKRNIIAPNLLMLSDINAPKCDNDHNAIIEKETMVLKLSDVSIRSQSTNPLYNVDLEIPRDKVYFYDLNKNLYDCISVSEEDSIKDAQDMVSVLHKTKNVSDDPKTCFEIKNGKLVRTCFICKCTCNSLKGGF